MSWVQGKDLLDIKLKHVPFVVVIIWLFALGLTLRVEQSSTYGTSNHIIERLQKNPKRSQNSHLEKAIKSQLNLKKIRVAKEDRLKKGRAGQSVNEEVAEIVSLHKDSGNPHLLIAFTNDAEANSMKVLKVIDNPAFLLSLSFSVLPLQSQRVREGATVVEASCDHNGQVRNF